MHRPLRLIIRKIASKHDLEFSAVKDAVWNYFKHKRTVMESGDRDKVKFKNFRIPYFGLFFVSNTRIKRIKEYQKSNQ